MVRLEIRGFFLDRENMPIVVLSDARGQRVLPVWVGPAEASAIIVELEGIRPPEPLTHDLLAGLFLRHGFHLECLQITGSAGAGLLRAQLSYRHRLRRSSLEARVSDGLALAVRLGAPILADETLFSSSSALLSKLGDLGRGLPFLKIPLSHLQHAPARATFN